MAKKKTKTRKRAAAKVAKKSKALKKKGARKAARKKTAIAKKRGKVAAKKKPARKTIRRKARPESFVHKAEHEVEAVATEIADIFTDAERLHQRLDPDISREPE